MLVVNKLRAMASECRELATLAKIEEVREQLLEVAEQFERTAEDQQQSAPPHRSHEGNFTRRLDAEIAWKRW